MIEDGIGHHACALISQKTAFTISILRDRLILIAEVQLIELHLRLLGRPQTSTPITVDTGIELIHKITTYWIKMPPPVSALDRLSACSLTAFDLSAIVVRNY